MVTDMVTDMVMATDMVTTRTDFSILLKSPRNEARAFYFVNSNCSALNRPGSSVFRLLIFVVEILESIYGPYLYFVATLLPAHYFHDHRISRSSGPESHQWSEHGRQKIAADCRCLQ